MSEKKKKVRTEPESFLIEKKKLFNVCQIIKEEANSIIMSQSPQLFEPRLCHVSKRADFDGYGFNLHAEKGRPGQYIGKVDESSPAETAGLRQGDRIIEVNGANIGSETHKQVVERIKSVPNHTNLLVIDPKADINNHQQLELIEKVKKSSNGVSDHENNNGKSKTIEEPVAETNHHNINNNHSPSLEVKVESNGNGNGNVSIDSTDSTKSTTSTGGTLNLPMTVAEMRAQLKSKKRPDPKTEGLDVRKKYEIIQKM